MDKKSTYALLKDILTDTCEICGKRDILMHMSRRDTRLSCFNCFNEEYTRRWNTFKEYVKNNG